jgi:SAM-dependent methyltransferase
MSATNPDADYGAPPPYSPGSNPDTDHDESPPDLPGINPDTEHDAPPPYSPGSNPDTDHDESPPDSPGINPDTEHDALPPDSPHDSIFSDTDSCESLDSRIVSYRQKYGRTYHNHNSGQYLLPNDDLEKDRLDLQHALFGVLLGGRLFLAPILTHLHNILDIGTGTGIWAMDMADLFDCASVLGIDISPIQPPFVPSNCEFQVEDADNDWTFRQSFDLIHCRQVQTAVDKQNFFRQAFNYLTVGGWVEIKEIALPFRCEDDTLNGTALAAWGNAMIEASRKIKKAFNDPYKYRQWMEEAGFDNVEESVSPVPLNSWPEDPKLKEVGRHQAFNLYDGIEGQSLILLIEILGWTWERVQVLLVDIRKEIRDRRIHTYMDLVCVVGQKRR